MGMEQRKMLYQYLTSGIVSTSSIQRFKRYPVLKTFDQKLQRNISKSVTLTSRLVRGLGFCSTKYFNRYVISGKVSTRANQSFRRYRLLKTLTKMFNLKFQST